MGRVLKRVPLDFNWPIGKVWEGYALEPEKAKELFGDVCDVAAAVTDKDSCVCRVCERLHPDDCYESSNHCLVYNDKYRSKWYKEPPAGDGYQLWETTTEGSPQSPVFRTLDELCGWCAENATTFSSYKQSKEEWRRMLDDGFVYARIGNVTFI